MSHACVEAKSRRLEFGVVIVNSHLLPVLYVTHIIMSQRGGPNVKMLTTSSVHRPVVGDGRMSDAHRMHLKLSANDFVALCLQA